MWDELEEEIEWLDLYPEEEEEEWAEEPWETDAGIREALDERLLEVDAPVGRTKRAEGLRSIDALFMLLFLLLFLGSRYSVRYIASGSMEPLYRTGALVVVDRGAYECAAPVIGEVAVYKSPSGREICHRIIGTAAEGFVFRGDNNDAEDALPVDPLQIRGKVVFVANCFAPLMRLLHGLDGA